MTLDEAHATLLANEIGAEGSFLFWLHEHDQFHQSEFWKLYNAGMIVRSASTGDDQELRARAFRIYDATLRIMLWHYCDQDLCLIEQMPEGDLSQYVERLSWALHPLICGRSGRKWDAQNSLVNPDQAALNHYFEQAE
jgi:hypothetical protein